MSKLKISEMLKRLKCPCREEVGYLSHQLKKGPRPSSPSAHPPGAPARPPSVALASPGCGASRSQPAPRALRTRPPPGQCRETVYDLRGSVPHQCGAAEPTGGKSHLWVS